MKLVAAALTLAFAGSVSASNGLGLRPSMGWSTWNKFGCDINEDLILSSASAIKESGLLKLGYDIIALDDCWHADSRDPKTQAPVADPVRFPSGMKALGDRLHEMGFRFGIYSSAGIWTCQRRFGSLGYETIDAQTYADWGVDYVKYDNCYNEGQSGTPELSFRRYKKMAEALKATGRDMLYALCNWGEDGTWNWATTFANSFRMSGDVGDNFDMPDDKCPCPDSFTTCLIAGYGCSITKIIEWAAPVVHKGFPGSFADLDGLEVGNGRLTTDEYKVQFSLWALVKSPLMLGNDVRNMSQDTLEVITNHHVIAVNQDPLGMPGDRVYKHPHPSGGDVQLWKGELSNGSFAIVVINSTPRKQQVNVDFATLHLAAAGKSFKLHDLWQDAKLLSTTNTGMKLDVPSHGVRVIKAVPREIHEDSGSWRFVKQT